MLTIITRAFYISLICLFLLSGCAYFIDKSIQPLTVKTIGAENAECIVDIDNLKHEVHPPQTINIGKSYEPMYVSCHAPGNRRQSITIPSLIEASTYLNVANGILPGVTWDVLSEAAFAYPDVVIVDFTGVMPSMNPLPEHNAADIIAPEDYDLEEFSPSVPRLNSDRNKKDVVIMPRKRAIYETQGTYVETGRDATGKGGIDAPQTMYPGE